MTPCVALHTAARRYCQERIAYWHQRYATLGSPGGGAGWTYSDRHKDVFPRYNVLDGILVGVERLWPESFNVLPALRNELWSIGQSAQGHGTEGVTDTIQQRAMQEERDRFSAFVDTLRSEELDAVEALPYRRTLLDEESSLIWDRLRQQFGLSRNPYWYPLQGEAPADTAAFDAEVFHRHVPAVRLQEILAETGIKRLWELREYGPEYEIDLTLLEPIYNGAEGFWTADAMDWLLYASHESTLTLSGTWLVSRVQAAWPTWREHRVG